MPFFEKDYTAPPRFPFHKTPIKHPPFPQVPVLKNRQTALSALKRRIISANEHTSSQTTFGLTRRKRPPIAPVLLHKDLDRAVDDGRFHLALRPGHASQVLEFGKDA